MPVAIAGISSRGRSDRTASPSTSKREETPSIAASPPDGLEQRRESRAPASDLSEIVVPGRKQGAPCLILDISTGGARLEVSRCDLPKRFMLVNYTRRTRTLCRLVWQQSRHIGVEFLGEPKSFELA